MCLNVSEERAAFAALQWREAHLFVALVDRPAVNELNNTGLLYRYLARKTESLMWMGRLWAIYTYDL